LVICKFSSGSWRVLAPLSPLADDDDDDDDVCFSSTSELFFVLLARLIAASLDLAASRRK